MYLQSQFQFYLYISSIIFTSVFCLEFRYHSQDELEEFLYSVAENVTEPLQTKVFSIGKSNKGRDLLVFEITAAIDNSDTIPNIQLTGNIHGNEATGREVLLHFIQFLIDNYETDARVQWLLQNSRIHILPCMNPDGWAISEQGVCVGIHGRHNNKSIDLNRNFPHFMTGVEQKELQVETLAVMNWMKNYTFVLAGDLHAGSVVTIYPFHRIKKTKYGYEVQSSITPDNNIFEHLANVYASNNEFMYKQSEFCDNETFAGGVTRGAAWYYFLGGMQDYNYMVHGAMALTFEVSCCKFPPEDSLRNVWEQNQKSLLMFCSEANRGVTAQLIESKTGNPITNANITILGIDKTFHPNYAGRFWKILLPGKYYLRVEADGYKTVESAFMVENLDEEYPKLTILEVEMNLT